MRKKILFFMLFALSLVTTPITAQETESVQIGFGTYITEANPIVNWWKCSYQGTENIYLKDELGLNAGDKIVSLSYYCMRGSASGGNFNVRMKNTSISTFDVVNDNNCYDPSKIKVGFDEPVYGNTTLGSYSGGEWITFDLQTPFVYEGENIIIDIRNTAPASRHGWCYFAETRFYGTNNVRSIVWRQAKSENVNSDGFYHGYDSAIYGNETSNYTGVANVIITYIPAETLPVSEFTVNGIHYFTNRDGESVTVTYTDNSNDYVNNYAGMTSADIPETVTYQGKTYNVTRIAYSAFRNCTTLKSVSIPNTVTELTSACFAGCSNLETVHFGNSITTIGGSCFLDCSSLKSALLPNSLMMIDNYAFYGCSSLSTVDFGNSVRFIGRSAFNSCTSLVSIDFPQSLASIGSHAFESCTSLTTLEIPSSVNAIGEQAFRYCSGIYYIDVDEANTEYDSRDYCNALIQTRGNRLLSGCKTSTIPNSVTYIDDFAFARCSGLKQIIIPAAVDTIGTEVFDGCYGLQKMKVDDNNPFFDSRDNCNAIIETASNTLLYGCKNTLIPADIEVIGEFAFYGQSAMNSMIIPPSVKAIKRSAFNSCTSLSYFKIPNEVNTLGNFVFSGCTGLQKVTIGSGVESMGRGCFYNCTALEKIISHITKPKDLLMGSDVFKNVDYSSCVLYVPDGTSSIYMTADQWRLFEIIKVYGDVNEDGVVTAADITELYNYMLNGSTTYLSTSDITDDGNVTAADITAIYSIMLGNQ